MQTLEVTLRNALNEAVKGSHAGKYANDDWWFEHIAVDIQDKKIRGMSPDNKKKWLKNNGKRKKQSYAEQAVLNVQRELKKEGRTPIRHDDVISRVTFGYWVSMLGNDFEDVTNKTLLWPNLLGGVFPHYSGKLTRVKVEASFKRIKDLRNRMSHHEPIWKFYRSKPDGSLNYKQPIYGLNPSLNLLASAYNKILKAIRWMSEDRYQSFVQAGLDIEFRKLCSHDGFYGFVDSSKIRNTVACSRFKREPLSHIKQASAGNVICVQKNASPLIVLGLNRPDPAS